LKEREKIEEYKEPKETEMSVQKKIPIKAMPLRLRHWYLFIVSSMEQIIGAALSTTMGVVIPLILLLGHPELSSLDQGLLGSAGLIGIAVGSVVFGRLMDSFGYLIWFRFCPILVILGAVGAFYADSVSRLFASLFLIGLSVGGGYSLDSAYLSEIMPEKWVKFFVGLAKATCSIGFVGAAILGYFLLKHHTASIWPYLFTGVGVLGVITFVLRIFWAESPDWLMAQNRPQDAQKSVQLLLGPEAEVPPLSKEEKGRELTWKEMFSGKSLEKVIFSGVPWACEGLCVYGFSVFLPTLVMALGLQFGTERGLTKILSSVEMTVYINIFIIAGFALGLWMLEKVNIVKLSGIGFVLSAIALIVLLLAFQYKWNVWVTFAGFILFELALNAGPHLTSFIIPSEIYSIEELGAGTGIAAMLGKVGAIIGVFFMPFFLEIGGVTLVLLISLVVQLIGAMITFIYGKRLQLF